MSDREKDELRASGKCFNCKETGHQARHCPKNNRISMPQAGSSSRMRNYNVEIDMKETERLRDLADTTEQLDTLTWNSE
jgi:hypothetical protein